MAVPFTGMCVGGPFDGRLVSMGANVLHGRADDGSDWTYGHCQFGEAAIWKPVGWTLEETIAHMAATYRKLPDGYSISGGNGTPGGGAGGVKVAPGGVGGGTGKELHTEQQPQPPLQRGKMLGYALKARLSAFADDLVASFSSYLDADADVEVHQRADTPAADDGVAHAPKNFDEIEESDYTVSKLPRLGPGETLVLHSKNVLSETACKRISEMVRRQIGHTPLIVNGDEFTPSVLNLTPSHLQRLTEIEYKIEALAKHTKIDPDMLIPF